MKPETSYLQCGKPSFLTSTAPTSTLCHMNKKGYLLLWQPFWDHDKSQPWDEDDIHIDEEDLKETELYPRVCWSLFVPTSSQEL